MIRGRGVLKGLAAVAAAPVIGSVPPAFAASAGVGAVLREPGHSPTLTAKPGPMLACDVHGPGTIPPVGSVTG